MKQMKELHAVVDWPFYYDITRIRKLLSYHMCYMHIKLAIEICARIASFVKFAKIIGREHFAIYGIVFVTCLCHCHVIIVSILALMVHFYLHP